MMKEIAHTSHNKTSFYYVMMFSAFWAMQIFVTKLGMNSGAQVLTFQSLSISASIMVLAVLVFPKNRTEFRDFFKNQPSLFWKLFFANGIQSGLGTCLSIIGIALTDAINAGFLVKLATVSTVFFAWLILNERLTFIKILMVIIMLSGAYLLTTKGQVMLPRIGDLFILAACVCWSLGNVLVRKYMQTQTLEVDIVTLQKPIAGLPVLLVLIGVAMWNADFLEGNLSVLTCCTTTLASIPFALGNGVCLALTWSYLNYTLKVTTASYMTMMSMVTPIIVSLLAVVFLHESLEWIQVAGAGLIIVSGVATSIGGIAQV